MTTQGGRTVTRFSIASTKKWTDKANKTHESTDWFRVATWGNLTKFASSLKKGDPVLPNGQKDDYPQSYPQSTDPQTGVFSN